MSLYLVAVSDPQPVVMADKERDRIRRIYADNIELKSRVENLEAKVQELSAKMAEVSSSVAAGRAQTPQIVDASTNGIKQQRRGSNPSGASTPKPLHIPRRASGFEGARASPSPVSVGGADRAAASAGKHLSTNTPSIPKPIAFLREYLFDLSRTQLSESDDLISYCSIFKSTADAVPISALDNVSRSRLFLDGLPSQIQKDIHRKCELQMDPQGYLAFDGIFVVAAVIVKSVDGFNRIRGKGRWEKRGGGALWTEGEMGGYLELIDEISKARVRHREWVTETGLKCKSLPSIDEGVDIVFPPKAFGWDLDGLWRDSLLIRY
ncbi:Hypothetical predicted protein [Lecanosticta acicola]|uniref:Uncharacterized protein n=1 Tax=Lecanosticta acicola TaxID=111012 RepID=A0AAI9EE64_9PEZI|nr:Hypothetical predicted protein [Lecanosticta acicola]